MTRPNFLVIGAQKSGTTSLCDALSTHPDVFVCDPKEPHFFARRHMWDRGLDWYESLFEGADGCAAIGDGSTTYSMKHLYPECADRVREHLGQPRIIYVLRNPVRRLLSHWMHDWSMGRDLPADVSEAVRTYPPLLDNSSYWSQLQLYRAFVPDERILVVFFEEMMADPPATLARCCAFLGVDPSPAQGIELVNTNPTVAPRITRWLRHNVPGYSKVRARFSSSALSPFKRVFKKLNKPPELTREAHAWVADRLRDDVAELMRYCGRPADHWRLDPRD